jgi:hypothetical protein
MSWSLLTLLQCCNAMYSCDTIVCCTCQRWGELCPLLSQRSLEVACCASGTPVTRCHMHSQAAGVHSEGGLGLGSVPVPALVDITNCCHMLRYQAHEVESIVLSGFGSCCDRAVLEQPAFKLALELAQKSLRRRVVEFTGRSCSTSACAMHSAACFC